MIGRTLYVGRSGAWWGPRPKRLRPRTAALLGVAQRIKVKCGLGGGARLGESRDWRDLNGNRLGSLGYPSGFSVVNFVGLVDVVTAARLPLQKACFCLPCAFAL